MDDELLKFPKDFLWGASTAAHQVEGGNHNDWSQWERANAARLAAIAPKLYSGSPVWDEIKSEATNPKNYISGKSSDHYNLYAQDFDLAAKIGLNSYRFSIEWSRIQPTKDGFDQAAIDHYRDVLKALKARNIEPLVTIWHWTLPLWLSREGGWTNPEVSHYFTGYAALLAREFGDQVKYWITLNEPNVFSGQAYLSGHWPPQKRNLFAYYKAAANMVKAHREAYHIIKTIQPNAQVGFSNHFIPYIAYRRRWINRLLKRFADWRWNLTFLYGAKDHLDFIGVNHYRSYRIDYGFNKPIAARRSDLGWELHPAAIYQTLTSLRRYKLPLIITENGLADRDDHYRSWYIATTLKHVHRAIAKGVDVRGYLHWSLLDNFEWDSGYWPRFGLIQIDYKTLERTIKPSALEYGKIIRANGVRPPKDN